MISNMDFQKSSHADLKRNQNRFDSKSDDDFDQFSDVVSEAFDYDSVVYRIVSYLSIVSETYRIQKSKKCLFLKTD